MEMQRLQPINRRSIKTLTLQCESLTANDTPNGSCVRLVSIGHKVALYVNNPSGLLQNRTVCQ